MFFFYKHTPPPKISPLPLHDPLPIWRQRRVLGPAGQPGLRGIDAIQEIDLFLRQRDAGRPPLVQEVFGLFEVVELLRSEEHTSELQSRQYLVCRLLLEKKSNNPDSLS